MSDDAKVTAGRKGGSRCRDTRGPAFYAAIGKQGNATQTRRLALAKMAERAGVESPAQLAELLLYGKALHRAISHELIHRGAGVSQAERYKAFYHNVFDTVIAMGR